MRVVQQLNNALHDLFEHDDRAVLIGEDLHDPYGGAFKVSKGLSTEFPERVYSTPISEAGFVGIATGMAMRGMRPIVEIMFGDFIALAMDQIVNHASKFRWMYDEKVYVPVVFRLPMGGRRGYGPTHSQSLEKLLLGIPGIKIVAPSLYHDWGKSLRKVVTSTKDPVFFIENKLAYPEEVRKVESGRCRDFHVEYGSGDYPSVTLSLADDVPDVTIICYGGMLEICEQAATDLLIEEEILCEVVVVESLLPLDTDAIMSSVARSGCAVVTEEGTLNNGWGAEVASQIQSQLFDQLEAPVARVAARNMPIGDSKTLENWILPNKRDVKRKIRKVIESKNKKKLKL